ncbi:MAG: dicarboxylate/amino acid:cation symporter [Bacteroidales bacterium]|nr:dicarboxylate/amino acid:cation symporter [Bacteroidales bacterium]
MNAFVKNYGFSLLLLAGVAIGIACGMIFGPAVSVVAPVGEFFLNLLFTMVVPMVFFSVASSICKMSSEGTAGKTIFRVFIVFLAMALVAGVVTYLFVRLFNPASEFKADSAIAGLTAGTSIGNGSFAQNLVYSFTVSDFSDMFSKSRLLPLIVFAVLVGFATSATKSVKMAEFLEQGTDVTMKMMSYVMFLAPLGLGCYSADMVASLGSRLITGFARSFVLFYVIAAVIFFVLHSVYILVLEGPHALKTYWKHILPPSITAFATTSSAAAIPGNIEAAVKMGVKRQIAESAIPLGTAIHKDGSMASGVLKIAFLAAIAGQSITGVPAAFEVLGIALLSGVVMGAVPGGAGTGEILICTMLGLDPRLSGLVIVIGTLVDMPATIVNSSSNVVSAIIVNHLDGGRLD